MIRILSVVSHSVTALLGATGGIVLTVSSSLFAATWPIVAPLIFALVFTNLFLERRLRRHP